MSFSSGSSLSTILALQREIIGQMLESGNGGSLAEGLFAPRQKSGKEIAAAALTGLQRSDAALLRQANRNAMQGKEIADTLYLSMSGISEALQSMSDIASRLAQSGTADNADALAYNEARQTISDLIKYAQYNGISLMDATDWNSDERLSVNGDTASLQIQMGNSSKTLSLTDIKSVMDLNNLPTYSELQADSTLATKVNSSLQTAQMYRSGYKGLAASFLSSANALEKQSDINERSAAMSILGARDDPAGRLLYYMLSEHGKLFNGQS